MDFEKSHLKKKHRQVKKDDIISTASPVKKRDASAQLHLDSAAVKYASQSADKGKNQAKTVEQLI